MNRRPPASVLRQLRREVGFGCPVRDCGNPYLSWHHFDPPWHERQHHDPQGMIALCLQHHKMADAGAFTVEQLRELKQRPLRGLKQRRGRFEWMRKNLVAVIGGNFFYDIPIPISYEDDAVIWFGRDDMGYFLLSLTMLSISGAPRARIRDNFWVSSGEEGDIICPPSGRQLTTKYPGGDLLTIEFRELRTKMEAKERYKWNDTRCGKMKFPITSVEITMLVSGTNIDFHNNGIHLPNNITFSDMFYDNFLIGIRLGHTPEGQGQGAAMAFRLTGQNGKPLRWLDPTHG